MAMQPFTWGAGGQKATPSSVKKHADIAAALAARSGAPKNLGEGLNRVGEALLANSFSSRAAAGEEEGAAARQAVMEALMANPDPGMTDIAGALGNEWVTSDPGSSAIVQALLNQEIEQNDPLRQLQMEQLGLENEALRNPQPEPGFAMLTPEEVAASGLPDGAYQRGPDNKIYEIGGGGVNVDMRQLGSIPPGYQVAYDEAGNPVSMSPVPGSPAALEAQAAADAAALSGERTDLKGGVVVQDIDRALQSITDNPALTTGIGSAVTGAIPSTPAYNVNALIDTVKANAGFAELQAMRESSPTGGALGNVTEKEIAYLQATIGNLDPRQSPQQLADNLKRVKNAYLDIIHGPGNGPAREPLSFEGDEGSKPEIDYNAETPPEEWGGDAKLWPFMSPEDRALW